MLSIETILTFSAASILLALAPGPDNIFVLTQSALHGKWPGIIVMLGLCTGLTVHTTAVALGVAIIFQTSAIAFSALKFTGACYLLYLAWLSFRAGAESIKSESNGFINHRKLYVRGIIMNIANPKVSVFFLAFLPQFADPARGAISIQMLMLGGIFILSTILVFGGIALVGGSLGQFLNRSERTQKVLNKIAGIVFLGLALKLAAAER